MTHRKSNQGTLRLIWEGKEEEYELNEDPSNSASRGRPAWWFKGSLFEPRTLDQKRLARLQYQITAKQEQVLSSRAVRIQHYIGLMSEWFPLLILDVVGKEIMLELDLRQPKDDFLAHFLGALESVLRQRYNTIPWKILQEINQITGNQLKKQDIYKWMFYTRQRKGERPTDPLLIVQHLTIEALTQETIPSEQKREIVRTLIQAIKVLRTKGFICKDPEVASWALKRIILSEKGTQNSIPRELRATTTRLTFRIRKLLNQ